MSHLKNILKAPTGIYKFLFCICVIILSFITFAINTDFQKSNEDIISYSNEEAKEAAIVQTENAEIVKQELQQDVTETNNNHKLNDTMPGKLHFVVPTGGEIQKGFSNVTPVYSSTLDDWRLHLGVDISCPFDSEIYSVCDGVVDEVGYDINMGNYVFIKNDNIEYRYYSLSSDVLVDVEDNVVSGQLIGYSSDSAISEICDPPHIHFEILADNNHVDPLSYIGFEK